ncbi:unnamed protein product [Prunus brigantina]
MGCSAVVLESDSAIAVHLLNKDVEDFHPLAAMLWGCQDYIDRNWVCSIHHVYRECNMAANRLAELGSCLELGLSTFHDPLDNIRETGPQLPTNQLVFSRERHWQPTDRFSQILLTCCVLSLF